MHGHFKSLDGNKYAQIFATKDYFAVTYPTESKALAGDALKEFITDYGVPDKIAMDGAGEQTDKRSTFMEQVQKHHINYHVTELEQYNQLLVEGVIREIRKKYLRVMTRKMYQNGYGTTGRGGLFRLCNKQPLMPARCMGGRDWKRLLGRPQRYLSILTLDLMIHAGMTEFRQPLQVLIHLEMPGILVQLGHIQCT